MSDMITEMAPEQEAKIPEWIEKWVKITLSTEPANFDKAEQAALSAYQLVGLEKPKIILRVASPYAAVEQGYLNWKSLNPQKSQIVSRTWSKIWLKLELRLRSQIWSEFWLQTWSQVWRQTESQIRSKIWIQINSQFRESIYNLYNGAFWAAEVAGLSFMRDILGWRDPILENFKIFEDLIIYCNYLWWHEDVLVISDRPEQIHLDGENRLHSESGPALVYRDGWSVWSWHGVTVPQIVIENPQKITLDMIESERNSEVKRIMIDRFGEQGAISYILASKSKIIDHDERWGTLYKRNIKNDEPIVMVEVINRTPEPDGTFKHYFLRVPPDIISAHQAVAWSFGKKPGKSPISGQRRQGDVLIERYDSNEYHPESES